MSDRLVNDVKAAFKECAELRERTEPSVSEQAHDEDNAFIRNFAGGTVEPLVIPSAQRAMEKIVSVLMYRPDAPTRARIAAIIQESMSSKGEDERVALERAFRLIVEANNFTANAANHFRDDVPDYVREQFRVITLKLYQYIKDRAANQGEQPAPTEGNDE